MGTAYEGAGTRHDVNQEENEAVVGMAAEG